MMRKWVALILAAVLCLAALPAAAEEKTEESIPESDGFRYRVLDDGTAEILEYVGKEYVSAIPETLDGYTVTSIGDEAFYHSYKVGELTIPDCVTHIGSSAFALSWLSSLEIPASVVSMGDNPFGYR